MNDAQRILEALSDAIVDMDEDAVARLSYDALSVDLPPSKILSDGLIRGMEIVGSKYDSGEYFVPELVLCSDALYAGLNVIRPKLVESSIDSRGTVVIGVVQGDTHDIGKNIVKIMLEGAGFWVIDLGRDVAPARFIDAAVEHDANVIALSTLMTTAMSSMEAVVDGLVKRGLRGKFKVVVGGAPISLSFAQRIGADGYAKNATEGARLVKSLVPSGVKAQ
jgi:corrinoid protein of di/trimethylamine methyltransferase